MLNEEKLKLMTGIAMFEKREGKKIFPVSRYFRSDYISSHVLRSFFSYSICYCLCLVIWALYNISRLLNSIDLDEVIAIGKWGAALYLAGLIIYLVITVIVYNRRYSYAKRGMKIYLTKMKRLEKRYEFQSRSRELTKEGGRHDGAFRT